jgi:hypothetical protein
MIANDNGNEVLRKTASPVIEGVNPGPYFFRVKETGRSSFERDAFERFRISTPTDIFDHKNTYSLDEFSFKHSLSGTSSITYNSNESCADISVGTAANDSAIRQTRHLPYTPGKSQLVIITGVFGASTQAGTVRRVGLFDNLNGLFLEIDGEDISFVVRSDVSGTAVDTKYARSEWADSLLDLDFSKTQILIIDFQWLGVGTVRFGFSIDGKTHLALQVNHANRLDKVYMRTASLPIRTEIFNKAEVLSPSTIKEICLSASSEALTDPVGLLFHASNQSALRSVGTSLVPVFAIRLKNSFKLRENRYSVFINAGSFFTTSQSTFFVVSKVYNPVSVTGTFESVNDESSVEYSTDITAYEPLVEQVIDCQIVPASSQGGRLDSSGARTNFDFLSEGLIISQNFTSTNSDLFLIRARTLESTSQVFSALTWYEVQ